MNEELEMDAEMELEIVELGDAKEETRGVIGTGFEDNPLRPNQFTN